jgi:hypothetical protein
VSTVLRIASSSALPNLGAAIGVWSSRAEPVGVAPVSGGALEQAAKARVARQSVDHIV